jgi:predicted ArsR family transcriptional regulator
VPRGEHKRRRDSKRPEDVHACLQECGPLTARQIAAEMGIPESTAHSWCRRLRDRRVPGYEIRILRFDDQPEQPGRPAAVYAAGAGRNAKRPPNYTPAERAAAARAACARFWQRHGKRKRALQHAAAGAPINPWAQILGRVLVKDPKR